ncbi:hypothetical protein A7J50_5919 (plasmid) [Pseudomonas antarctica]|uniref:Uncharacterized protein n=1 Tax=Pseudomonas antarctica TaxID=219572 RepID=A0A172ZAZ0_9PSED|nr:hypothetical protein [Pseudomonas antarctica]ANF89239.1 hypothetical protein A7J50_5919 [Pseudomonas antarctica]
MSTSTKHSISLAYEHDGEARQAYAEVSLSKICIIFAGLPSMKFQVSLLNPMQVILELPTDRKGKKPKVSCDISSIPELEVALGEVSRQGWLDPKVVVSDCA